MILQELLVNYRRELHQYPELSLHEYDTTKRIKRWLEEQGIVCLDLGIETGVVADIQGEQDGPVIALRSDIDALPIQETSGVEYASLNSGIAHCCGHDTHMAVMLGAAILLNKRRHQLKGRIRIIFQPGEESSHGADWFLGKYPGLIKDVKAIFGVHNKPELPVGTIGIRSGPLMASVDKFSIEIKGKSGHGGMPEICIDPIAAGGQLINSLQTIVSRRISPLSNAVVSITQFHSGSTWNVIPEIATMEGTVRTFQTKVRAQIPNIMKEICHGISKATGTKITLNWSPSVGVVDNDPQFKELMTKTGRKLGLEIVEAQQNLAGEDFAYYQSIIPGFFVFLGSDGPHQWHHPAYSINEACLEYGAKYFAELAEAALDYFTVYD